MKNKSTLFTEILIFIGGLALLIAGLYFLKSKMDFFKNTVQTQGVVIDIQSIKSNKMMYSIIVEFHAIDGNTYSFSPETSSSSAFDYEKGQKLSINYDEKNPNRAKINSFKERWGLPLALIISGLIISLSMGVKIHKIFFPHKTKSKSNLPPH